MKRPPQFILGLFVGIAICGSFAVLRGQTASGPPVAPASATGQYQIAVTNNNLVVLVDTTSGRTWWSMINDPKNKWTPHLAAPMPQ
jgi:hypothetical protein